MNEEFSIQHEKFLIGQVSMSTEIEMMSNRDASLETDEVQFLMVDLSKS